MRFSGTVAWRERRSLDHQASGLRAQLLIVDKLPEDSYEHSVSPSSHGEPDAGTPTALTATPDSSQHPADEHTSLLP